MQPNTLSQNWPAIPLKYLAALVTGSTPPKNDAANYSEDGIPWVKPDDLNNLVPVDTSEERLSATGESISRVVPSGSVLVCCIGTVGKIGIAGTKLATNQQINSVVFDRPKKFSAKFGAYALMSSEQDHLRCSNKVVVAILNKTGQGNIPIPTPPISKQQSIAAYLDEQTAKIDQLMDMRRRQMALLKEQRAALIQEAVTRGLNPNAPMKDSGLPWLGEIPAHWEMRPLGSFASVKARLGWKGLKAEEYVDEGYIFLATPNLKGEAIDFDNVNYITKARYDESPEIMLRERDVLMVKDGATLGIVSLVKCLPAPATINGSSAVIRPHKEIDSEFLSYWLRSNGVQQLIDMMKGGMGVPHLFQTDIRRFPVTIPPMIEQEEITLFIKNGTSKLDSLHAAYTRQINLLTEYRKALIHECVTGQRSVPETITA
jgi:type I restriction enzyme S subunit